MAGFLDQMSGGTPWRKEMKRNGFDVCVLIRLYTSPPAIRLYISPPAYCYLCVPTFAAVSMLTYADVFR